MKFSNIQNVLHIYFLWIIETTYPFHCFNTGFCSNKKYCNVSSDSVYDTLSDDKKQLLHLTTQNPGKPVCSEVIKCVDKDDCFHFCWRGPYDVSIDYVRGFYIELAVFGVKTHLMNNPPYLIQVYENQWQSLDITQKKNTKFCMSCDYNSNHSTSVYVHIWSLPTVDSSTDDTNDCEWQSLLETERTYLPPVNDELNSLSHVAVIAVSIVLVLSIKTCVVLYLYASKRSGLCWSQTSASVTSSGQDYSTDEKDDGSGDEETSFLKESAVTLGEGVLPAPSNKKEDKDDDKSSTTRSAITLGQFILPAPSYVHVRHDESASYGKLTA